GRLNASFLAEEFPSGFHGAALDAVTLERLVAVAATIHQQTTLRDHAISGQMLSPPAPAPRSWVARIDRANYPLAIEGAAGRFEVSVGERRVAVASDWCVGQRLWIGAVEEEEIVVQVDRLGTAYVLLHGGAQLAISMLTPRAAELADLMPNKPPPDL